MRTTQLLLAVVMVAAHPALAAAADALPDTVTWSELVVVLKKQSPVLGLARANVAIAAADLTDARLYSNPLVSISGGGLVGGEATSGLGTYQLSYTQPILVGGQRQARLNAAQRGVEAVQSLVDVQVEDVARNLRDAFVTVIAREARVRVLKEALAHMAQIEHIVKERAKSGAVSRYDVLRISTEQAKTRSLLLSAEADVNDAQAALGAILGLPGWRPKVSGKFEALGVSTNPAELRERALKNRAAIASAKRVESATRLGVDVAKAERWPDLLVTLGTNITNGPTGGYLFGGLGISIPMFDFGQGKVERANARVIASTVARELTETQAEADVVRAARLLVARQKSYGAYEAEVVAKMPDLRAMAEDAYKTGKATILDLLDSFRGRTETQLTRVDFLEAVLHAEVAVLSATGEVVQP